MYFYANTCVFLEDYFHVCTEYFDTDTEKGDPSSQSIYDKTRLRKEEKVLT